MTQIDAPMVVKWQFCWDVDRTGMGHSVGRASSY
jgi:hypothetical protein